MIKLLTKGEIFTYSEMTFDNYKANSFLKIDRTKEVGIKFHSLTSPDNRK